MGIPHLITFLRPYAVSKTITGCDVIVDGPGLCYHIHYKCLAARPEARNALEAAPSYEELGEAAIEWLDGLQKTGATVNRIYFDGFLPPAKLSTRLKRLEAQTRQLIEYHKTHRIPCRVLVKSAGGTANSVFASPAARPALTSLPPPSFLVPAILEALQNHEVYRAVTAVVPGEADLYCARYLKKYGGVIFTGDSDLLVHDLGSNGAVAFFKDVEPSSDGKLRTLQSQFYNPEAITKRLKLPKSDGLRGFVFEMVVDSHGTFQKLLVQAVNSKAIKMHEKMYQAFCAEYIPLDPEVKETLPSVTIQQIFHSLDPRISEFALQFPALAKLAGQDARAGKPSQEAPRVFLPFLLDCPVRTSAWEMSTSVRQLAYGLLNLIVPDSQRRFTVYEHRRQQKGREWQLPNIEEIPDACMAVVKLLDQIGQKLPDNTEQDIQLALALCHDIEWASSLDKTPLMQSIMDQLFDMYDPSKYHKNCTWDVMQFLAQIQASYYSFRILKQISSLVFALGDADILPTIGLLHDRLKVLKWSFDVPDLSSVSSLYQGIEKNSMLKIAYEVLGLDNKDLEPAGSVEVSIKSSKKKEKKRKRKATATLQGPSTEKKKLPNPFELLVQE